jgi:hypothetical protein
MQCQNKERNPMRSNLTMIASSAALLMVLAACGSPTGDGPEPIDTTLPQSPETTTPSPTTTAPAETTTMALPLTSTTAPTSSTTAPNTTTSTRSVVYEAEGSGCTPGPGKLPDGEWFGYVVTTKANEIEFDLACWFSGDAAIRASKEDGQESPPPNDYYVRNINKLTRPLSVNGKTEVVWYPEVGDPTSEGTTTYEDWLAQIEKRELMLGIWVEIEGGTVVEVHEQWTP